MLLYHGLGWIALVAVTKLLAVSGATSHESFDHRCLTLRPESLIANSTLTRLEFVPAGTTIDLSDNVDSCNRREQKVEVDLCRVGLRIPTSKRSSISFELWLPREWEGARYLATGNGGVDGCAYRHGSSALSGKLTRVVGIKYEDLAYGTSHGFATMGTNNGHNGTTAVTMLHNPDIIEDFSYRA